MDLIAVQTYIKNGDLKSAKELLSQANFKDKQSKQYLKTLKLYESKTKQMRKVFVDKSITKINNYIKEKNYEQAYHLIQDLENIDSTNSKVIKLKSKIITKLNQKLQSSAKSLLDSSKKEINQLLKSDQDQKALELTFNLTSLPDSLRKDLELETKRKIIDKKLRKNKSSLKKTPAPQKYDFIKNLYDLEPNYPKIQELLLESRNELNRYSKIQKTNILRNLYQETKILFNKRQYEKTKQNAKRILSIDPTNNKAIRYYKKADHCYYTDSYEKAYKILQSKTSK